jgi:hypothetical protein
VKYWLFSIRYTSILLTKLPAGLWYRWYTHIHSKFQFLRCTYLAKRLRELSSTKIGSYPHEFLCRTDCSACADYQPWLCYKKKIETLAKSIVPRKTWRKLWLSYISKLFLTKRQVKFSIFFHRGSLNVWYRQSISIWFFVKRQCQSPFPLSLESWHLLKVDRE